MIAAGGTGGHIYPGIAVAQEIRRRDANSKVHFVGTARGLETRLVPQAGFELSLIESAGLKNVSLGARAEGNRDPAEEFFLNAPADARVSAGRSGWRRRLRFWTGCTHGSADESTDARDGVECVAGLDQPGAG